MVIGNVGALRQKNFRRFMAYSSIAQVGYLMLALLAPPAYATGSILTYLFIYTAGNMAAFYVFTIAAQDKDESMDVIHGLHARSPVLAAVLMLAMFSLAGVPPLGGFIGKIYLFAGAAEVGRYGLVLFASLNSVASLFYYMTVIRAAYLTPVEDVRPLQSPSRALVIIAILLGAALVILGILAPFHHAIFRLSA
jgi:NADH-quinone oxidoreductase subunit N